MNTGAEVLGPSIQQYDQPKATNVIDCSNVMFIADVLQSLKLKRSTLYKKIKERKIPPPIGKYNGRSYWKKDQIKGSIGIELEGA